MNPGEYSRRTAVLALGLVPVLATLPVLAAARARHRKEDARKNQGEDTAAAEDLMREHGVLRRVLIVYSETIPKLRNDSEPFDARAIAEAATLFRDFGENYHERVLEEEHIFPELRKAGANNARLVEILEEQHRRGREITKFILDAAQSGTIVNGADVARAMEGMVRMYRAHTSREDTILFPAWKKLHSKAQLDEISEQFEAIEHEMFGKDGFDDAVRRIAGVERQLGLEDLKQFTAPPVPV